MAIRVRKISGHTIAICAAISEPKQGDIYLDDGAHEALHDKFDVDYKSMGFIDPDLADSLVDEERIKLMIQEQGGKLLV